MTGFALLFPKKDEKTDGRFLEAGGGFRWKFI
jgi:hypothetical protein